MEGYLLGKSGAGAGELWTFTFYEGGLINSATASHVHKDTRLLHGLDSRSADQFVCAGCMGQRSHHVVAGGHEIIQVVRWNHLHTTCSISFRDYFYLHLCCYSQVAMRWASPL